MNWIFSNSLGLIRWFGLAQWACPGPSPWVSVLHIFIAGPASLMK